ncbi:MAG TPA: hypothetical protein VM802_07955 [Chitinophaga sp.]|uniref:hypothetical protein n=1 Tax=Chitinophaga sp. TaxID=1869181 RepID=UPI002C2FCB53|nr:hypothetical protein [Chitinophaga sp.]HVI44788.1 hypothetical protein [Chitinophaga sp.]
MMLDTPVLFLVFNRPAVTQTVFEAIRRQRPRRLFLAADGPRSHVPGEAQLCYETRKVMLDRIDWPCEVKTLFRNDNLGCGQAVSSAINWFFEQVEEGIILEDDCLPNDSFFTYVSRLLDYYRHNERVMHIGASNFQQGIQRNEHSYYFSRYTHIWGWATWRRAWQHYEFSPANMQQSSMEGLNRTLQTMFKAVCLEELDTWDVQWFMTVWYKNGYAVIPHVNLVRNIGMDLYATHTRSAGQWFGAMQYGEVGTLQHPPELVLHEEADRFTADAIFNSSKLSSRIRNVVRNNMTLYRLYKKLKR